jgi:hypothetical protein
MRCARCGLAAWPGATLCRQCGSPLGVATSPVSVVDSRPSLPIGVLIAASVTAGGLTRFPLDVVFAAAGWWPLPIGPGKFWFFATIPMVGVIAWFAQIWATGRLRWSRVVVALLVVSWGSFLLGLAVSLRETDTGYALAPQTTMPSAVLLGIWACAFFAVLVVVNQQVYGTWRRRKS